MVTAKQIMDINKRLVKVCQFASKHGLTLNGQLNLIEKETIVHKYNFIGVADGK